MVVKAEVVIVGAGPAGLAAALEASSLGAEVLLLDESISPGGQYFMQPGPARRTDDALPAQIRSGRKLVRQVRDAGAEIWTNAQVWGLFPGRRITVYRGGISQEILAERLIIATGAHDRNLAFPGWTLPGVLTPGGAQRLMKSEGIKPGQRAVLAGNGPFLLVVARQLLKAGVEIAAYVESARFSRLATLRVLRFPEIWLELATYLWSLRRHHVPVQFSSAVTAAHGQGAVERVSISPLDHRSGQVVGQTRDVQADVLIIGQGFRASTELTALAGCEHRYSDLEGGRICAVNRNTGETSVETIYAAGEITGVAGWRPALEEGGIAGLCAARTLGHWSVEAERRLARARRRRRRFQALADHVNRTFAATRSIVGLITDDTIVCRCEDVCVRDLREAIDSGAQTAAAIKMWTRCGMGPCQGRVCGWTLAHVAAQALGVSLESFGVNEPRVPIKPVPVGSLLGRTAVKPGQVPQATTDL